MDELISTAFGLAIFKRNGKYIVKYDSGEIVSKTLEAEITKEEIQKAQKSERDAYEVLLVCDRRSLNNN